MTYPNGHGKYAAPDNETGHARFPLPIPLPQACEGGNDSLREFHIMAVVRNAGFSLIEIMVTIVILMIGLLGLAGLQGRALTSQLESYQRSQALVLLKDMENRINANRKNVASYVTASALGTGAACPVAVSGVISSVDQNEWCNALMGAAEVQSGAAAAGAIIGARGCIYETAASAVGVPGKYMIAVAWQGMNSTAAPTVACGAGEYGNETQRRVVTLPVFVGVLN